MKGRNKRKIDMAALNEAVRDGRSHKVATILNQTDLLQRPGYYLSHAIARGGALVQTLLEAGADPNVIDDIGVLPLYTAIWHKQIRSVRLLIAAGANVNKWDPRYALPIMHANTREMLRELLSAGARLYEPAFLLRRAALDGNLDVVDELLNNGANPDGGCTLPYLMLDRRNERSDIVKRLLAGGADPNLTLNHYTPLCLAVTHCRNLEIICALILSGAERTQATKMAADLLHKRDTNRFFSRIQQRQFLELQTIHEILVNPDLISRYLTISDKKKIL